MTTKLSEKEWRLYQDALALFVESERLMIRDEFHAIMGVWPEELSLALGEFLVEDARDQIELPDSLVIKYISLLGCVLIGYPFSEKNRARIEHGLGVNREGLVILKRELRVRMGFSPTGRLRRQDERP